MNGTFRRLPDAELEVMQAVWDCTPPVTRAGIDEILHKTHPMAQTTLLTLLTRLAEKGFISIEKNGRRSEYVPLVVKQDYLASQSRRFFDKLCGGSVSAFASALCDGGLTKEEIAELRRLLDEGAL